MKNVPKEIFLVIGDNQENIKDFNEFNHEFVYWSQTRTGKTDIEYVIKPASQSKWISVDNPPPEGEDVMVSDGAAVFNTSHQFINGKWYGYFDPNEEKRIKFWQSFPTPPEK